jgi:hypothetical protein
MSLMSKVSSPPPFATARVEAAVWPQLPDLLAAHEGPKALKDLISASFAPAFALPPTAAQMGIYHLCYDLLSPQPIHRDSTLQAIKGLRDRAGTPLFQSLVGNLVEQKKNSPMFYEARSAQFLTRLAS